jgi:hypothetical protein
MTSISPNRSFLILSSTFAAICRVDKAWSEVTALWS